MARYDEADTACAHARSLAPDASWGYVASSWLEEARGRIDEALKWNTVALKASPDEFELYDDRAKLLMTLGLAARAREALEHARAVGGHDEAVAVRLAEVSYYENGPTAAMALLQSGRFDSSTRSDTLLRAARVHMLLADASVARNLLQKALVAPDLSRSSLDHLWYLREGESYGLVLALAEQSVGDRHSADQHLDTLSTSLEHLTQAGVERYGVYYLKAAVLAQKGDAEGAMVALGHAAELGWRSALLSQHDPALASLQTRPDFRALIGRLQQQDHEMSARLTP
jgi:tetratricopeptide (TPR) repeat protein